MKIYFNLMKINVLILMVIFLVSSCSMQQSFSDPQISKKEITKILNDGCNIKRNKRERYKINGKRYRTLSSSNGYKKRGVASWYGSKFDGKATACGEKYDMYKYTAAHKTLPLPSYVNVKNLTNGKSVIVKINDRGPFIDNRIIDLSYAAAKKIDMLSKGTAFVRLTSVSEAEAAESFKKNNLGIFSTNIFERIVLRNKNKILIQIGAFTEEKGAQELKNRVIDFGVKSVFINKSRSGNRIFYRVRVGPISDVESYEDTIRRLTSLKLDINLISQ